MALINLPGVLPNNALVHQIPIGVSPLGTPVFDDVTFPRFGFYVTKIENGNEETVFIETSELKLQAVKLFISREKEIIKTKVQGREGTIEEYFASGDIKILMSGSFAELFNNMPYDQLKIFSLIEQSPDPAPVICRLLNDVFDITYLNIHKFDVSTIPGSTNMVEISIEADKYIPFDPEDFVVSRDENLFL